jgi:protein gp37
MSDKSKKWMRLSEAQQELGDDCRMLSDSQQRQHGRKTRVTYLDGEQQLFVRVTKKRAGRVLDGRTWDQFPEGK